MTHDVIGQAHGRMITLLARADPAAAERLTDIYLAYRRAIDAQPSGDPVK